MDSPRSARKEETWDELVEYGITSVALMFEGHNEKYNPFYSYDDVEKICGYAKDRGMVVGVTDWPWPNNTWMDDMYAYTRRMFDPNDLAFPLVFHESDVEGNWLPKRVKDFDNLDLAGDRLVVVKTAVVEGTIARRETTSFTSHTENGRAADVAPHMDAVFNQAYGVRSRKKRDGTSWLIPWKHTYGPGNMVRHTLDRSLQIPGMNDTVRLGAGLAAYDQKWPGHSAKEAMTVSYNSALIYRPFEVRWWSYKWLFGHVATSYGRPFLTSVM
jgi:hypothetical protein